MLCCGRFNIKSWFNKLKLSMSEKLLKRQQKVQNKFCKTTKKQQIKREKQLCLLKKAACRPPPACHPPPNGSPSNLPPSACNPPPPCPSTTKPSSTTRSTVSSDSGERCDSEQYLPQAKAMKKQGSGNRFCKKVKYVLCSHATSKSKGKCQKRGEARNLCCRCIICCLFLGAIFGVTGFAIPILAGIIPPSLSTCAQCDFCLEPPKISTSTLKRQTPCLGLDKLIQEERDNQEWNVAFQKALVKRLEASERRITLDDYLDDDDGGGSRRKRKRKDVKEKETVTEKPKVKTEKAVEPLPEAKEVFKEKKCPCSRKIKREERKRKTFVKIMEREQIRFEKRSLRAQRRYDKERQKAYKRCEYTQLAMEKGYFKRNKDGVVDKAEETFSVFIHTDPAQCACKGKAACLVKCKKCFFKCCVWLYVIGFITFFVTSYFLTKI